MKVRIFVLVCLLAVLSFVGLTLANAKTVSKPDPQDLSIKANYAFVDDYEVPALTKYVQKRSKVKLSEYQAHIIVTSAVSSGNKLNVDPTLVLAVAEVESEFNPKASNYNAYGLMQVIPYWHKDKIKSRDLRQAKDQIAVGTEVLAEYIAAGGSVRKGLKKYSGGSDKYATKVLKARNRIRLHVVKDLLDVSV